MTPVPESEHPAGQPNMFAYFVNLSKHPSYTMIEKVSLSQSGRPSLNPEVVLSKEAMEARVPVMPRDQGRLGQSGVDSIVKQEQVVFGQPGPDRFNELHGYQQDHIKNKMAHGGAEEMGHRHL